MLQKIGKRGQASLDPSQPLAAIIYVLFLGIILWAFGDVFRSFAVSFLENSFASDFVLLSWFHIALLPILWLLYFIISGIYLYTVVVIGGEA